ncbi:AAA family ATPase [Pseudomaricurvus sp.]|uniref:AAA family ATPase n=1 Tax=Pseudomaricurvus sp. TaxID=2004510 RepID=UPI003F6C6889
MKQLWMLVGGNGAGKSTFYHQVLQPLGMPFINADLIAKELYPDNPEANSYQAARLAEQLRYDQLAEGNSFCFETVFSHPSKIDFVAHAKALGYQIILVVIHVQHGSLNQARVAQRVDAGGHHVPDDKVLSRIPRMLENVKATVPLCDQVRVLDNSRLDLPFNPILTIKAGVRTHHIDPLPHWAVDF